MANILDSIKALTLGQKITYVLVLGGTIAALLALTFWSQQPEYQTLFSNLSSDDASSIMAKLKDKKIPYKIEAGGSVISIPSEKVYETRLELAGEGLPQGGGIGFEIFDKTNLGMTEFTQKVNYKRALQGELSRTIKGLAEVQDARVHLVMPEKSLFVENEQKSRASVVVKLKPSKKLSQNQVQGIVHLVSSSVEGLEPSNVTVVNTMGQMLTKVSDADTAQAMTSSQMEYQKAFEKDIETRLQAMIEKVVGVNKVSASVSADIDFKRIEKTEERYDPDVQVVRSEQRSQEKSSGGGLVPAGVPGVASNLPAGQKGQTTAGTALPSTAQRQSETVNYEINKIISRTLEPTGTVKKLSVAVLVDGNYETVKDADGKEQKKYTQRSGDEIKKIEDLVKGAVGFTSERGDKVTVVNIPFETGGVSADEGAIAAEESAFKEYLPYAIKYGTAILLALLIIFFVVRPLTHGLGRQGEAGLSVEAIQRALPGTVAELEAQFGGEKAITAGAPQVDVMQRLAELARQNPQQTAQIIRTWLK